MNTRFLTAAVQFDLSCRVDQGKQTTIRNNRRIDSQKIRGIKLSTGQTLKLLVSLLVRHGGAERKPTEATAEVAAETDN
jgi:hypothetical protein